MVMFLKWDKIIKNVYSMQIYQNITLMFHNSYHIVAKSSTMNNAMLSFFDPECIIYKEKGLYLQYKLSVPESSSKTT